MERFAGAALVGESGKVSGDDGAISTEHAALDAVVDGEVDEFISFVLFAPTRIKRPSHRSNNAPCSQQAAWSTVEEVGHDKSFS